MSLTFHKIMQQAKKNRAEVKLKLENDQPQKVNFNGKLSNGTNPKLNSPSTKDHSGTGPNRSAVQEFLARQKAEQDEEAKRRDDEKRRLLATRMKEKDKNLKHSSSKSDKNASSALENSKIASKSNKQCKIGDISSTEERRSLERRKAEKEIRNRSVEKFKSASTSREIESNKKQNSSDKRTYTYLSKSDESLSSSKKRDTDNNHKKKDDLKNFKIPTVKKLSAKGPVDFTKLMQVAVKNRDHGTFDDYDDNEPVPKKRKISFQENNRSDLTHSRNHQHHHDSKKLKKHTSGNNDKHNKSKESVAKPKSSSKHESKEKLKNNSNNNNVKLKPNANKIELKIKHPSTTNRQLPGDKKSVISTNVPKSSAQLPDKNLPANRISINVKQKSVAPSAKQNLTPKPNVSAFKLEQFANARKIVSTKPSTSNGGLLFSQKPLPRRPGTPPKTLLPRRPGTPPGGSKTAARLLPQPDRSFLPPATYAKSAARRAEEARAREHRREMMFKHPERFAGSHGNRRPGYAEEDEEEDDSDMDSFIDDTEYGDNIPNVSEEIHKLFKYDPKKFAYDDGDDPSMEASYKDIEKEEARSARLGMMEDLADIQMEMDQLKRKGIKKSKNTLI